jgi:hypothetical protein
MTAAMSAKIDIGDVVHLTADPDVIHIFDKATHKRLGV